MRESRKELKRARLRRERMVHRLYKGANNATSYHMCFVNVYSAMLENKQGRAWRKCHNPLLVDFKKCNDNLLPPGKGKFAKFTKRQRVVLAKAKQKARAIWLGL